MQTKLSVALVFVIGCIAGGAASQMVVPKARAGTNPQRWEYFCSQSDHIPLEAMNKAGGEGWELVSMVPTKVQRASVEYEATSFSYCYKRPAL